MTPLQEMISRLMLAYEKRVGRKVSGREFSTMLGKSRNHISQVLNDGLVPSGDVIVKLGEVLAVDDEERRELMMAAMETKAKGHSHDTFWLREAIAIVNNLTDDLACARDYVESHDLGDAFESWLTQSES